MPPFKVVPATLDDATAIARNNIPAFWEDKNWVLMWTRKNKSLEYVTSQAELRWAHNLIKDPVHLRREKAIDVSTGELVGFATWVLPNAAMVEGVEDEAGKQKIADLWPEARVPEVDEHTRAILKQQFDGSDWESDRATNALAPPIREMRKRLKGDKT